MEKWDFEELIEWELGNTSGWKCGEGDKLDNNKERGQMKGAEMEREGNTSGVRMKELGIWIPFLEGNCLRTLKEFENVASCIFYLHCVPHLSCCEYSSIILGEKLGNITALHLTNITCPVPILIHFLNYWLTIGGQLWVWVGGVEVILSCFSCIS